MGTNFYILGHTDTDKPEFHIGKRSAAGLYCWDCHTTFCKDGERGVHTSRSEWHDKCPSCGKKYIAEGPEESAAGVELGWAKNIAPHTGVRTVCSFTWAMKPSQLFQGKEINKVTIEDEYHHKYSQFEFAHILTDMCPIEFYDIIGKEFS